MNKKKTRAKAKNIPEQNKVQKTFKKLSYRKRYNWDAKKRRDKNYRKRTPLKDNANYGPVSFTQISLNKLIEYHNKDWEPSLKENSN